MFQLKQYLLSFEHFDQEELNLIESFWKPKSFKKGTLLLAPGQIQKELYFIQSGHQIAYFEDEKKTYVVAFTYAPSFCAVPDAFQLQKPSNTYLKCITDSQLLCISYDDLQKLYGDSRKLESLFRKLTEHILAGVINRHIELHSLSIEERFRLFCQRSAHLLKIIPHKYIASYLGIDSTNFSKLYNSIKI